MFGDFLLSTGKLLMIAFLVGTVALMALDLAGEVREEFKTFISNALQNFSDAVLSALSVRILDGLGATWPPRARLDHGRNRRTALKTNVTEQSEWPAHQHPHDARRPKTHNLTWQLVRFALEPEARAQLGGSLIAGFGGVIFLRRR